MLSNNATFDACPWDAGDELHDVLPKIPSSLDTAMLMTRLRTFNRVPMDIEGTAFGKTYEYSQSKFAMSEGQKGGELFMPASHVKLIVDAIEPFTGRLHYPACGSGGMFIESVCFIKKHRRARAVQLRSGRTPANHVGRREFGLEHTIISQQGR